MQLTPYEKTAQREIDVWLRGDASPLMQAFDIATRPLDWLVERTVPEGAVEQASNAVGRFLSTLNDASEWTYDYKDLLREAEKHGIEAGHVEALRDAALDQLDPLARRRFTENALLAAVEGGGTGMGGAVFIAADVPLLFTINLRLIQQVAGAYGFPMRRPEYRALVLAILNAAASASKDAKHDAMREISVAAASLAGDGSYRGRNPSGTLRDQSRNLPREIGKNIVGRKLAQSIPVAGAAVGAGVNYWFTREVAETSYMLCRALYLEYKERR